MVAEPNSELEERQRAAIRILMKQLGMEDSMEEAATLDAILVAGEGDYSAWFQRQNEARQDELNKWNLHMTWAREQVKACDSLTIRVAEAKEEVAAAEA